MQKTALAIMILFSSLCVAQGEANTWYFGHLAGLKFNGNNQPIPLTGGQIDVLEGCSAISNSQGNLLFYTDGRSVWDKNHIVMPNGNYFAGTGLFGDPSSTQSALIVPNVDNPNLYYIFTVDEPNYENAQVYPNQNTAAPISADDGYNNGLNYSIVDLSIAGANGSMGNVTSRNNGLLTYNDISGNQGAYKCSEKITAVLDAEGSGFWVVTHFVDKFYSFHVDASGVQPSPVISVAAPTIPISGYGGNSHGYFKASPNGKKLAIAHSQVATDHTSAPANGQVLIYDFNQTTGAVSGGNLLLDVGNPYGIEFSATTKKLYATVGSGTSNDLVQFDLESGNIAASKAIISTMTNIPGALQLAVNKKIYMANFPSNKDFLGVINNPENGAGGVDFVQNGQPVAAQTNSSLGLPPFITSFLLSNIEVEDLCVGKNTSFFINVNTESPIQNVSWDFGDGATGNSQATSHQYAQAGDYVVSVVVNVSGSAAITKTKTITIHELPVVADVEISQCDTDGDNITSFDLNVATALLNPMSQIGVEIKYFKSEANAENNVNPIANLTDFSNENQDRVYALFINPFGCTTIAEVTLKILDSDNSERIHETCDSDEIQDGFLNVNLQLTFSASILSGLPPGLAVRYFPTLIDATNGTNAIGGAFRNTTNPQSLYATVVNGLDCYGITKVTILVNTFSPSNFERENLILCDGTSLEIGVPENFASYIWQTGEQTNNITVDSAGIYSVKVTDSNGCKATKIFDVIKIEVPRIAVAQVKDFSGLDNSITVICENSGAFLYSIDNVHFQESSVFTSVAAGLYDVVVKDRYGCGEDTVPVTLLDYPRFFTPNGDGYNDEWGVKNLMKLFPQSEIRIFDRYGKLLKVLNNAGSSWTGNYAGQPLPSTDYWFTLSTEDGKNVRGHFSLKR